MEGPRGTIHEGDALSLLENHEIFPSNHFDYVFTSPPLMNALHKSRGGNKDTWHKKRSGRGEPLVYGGRENDLGNIEEQEEYIFQQVNRVLGAYLLWSKWHARHPDSHRHEQNQPRPQQWLHHNYTTGSPVGRFPRSGWGAVTPRQECVPPGDAGRPEAPPFERIAKLPCRGVLFQKCDYSSRFNWYILHSELFETHPFVAMPVGSGNPNWALTAQMSKVSQ